MKIRGVNNAETGARSLPGMVSVPDSEDKSVVFQRSLIARSQEQYEARLAEMISSIDRQGEILSKRADIKEFERYRSLIREFMDEVVSGGYEFSKQDSFASRGRHRVLATVQKVNEKLDSLAQDVLGQQADNITIIHQIDDIRGLLLDMML